MEILVHEEPKSLVRTYPYIGIAKTSEGTIVLFIDKKKGIVLRKDRGNYHKIGDFADDWLEAGSFEVFRGVIELSQ